jgi:hypothetical protein
MERFLVTSDPNISIRVLDEPGPGGASHRYELMARTDTSDVYTQIKFQKGPIAEEGVNGLTQEALLAIVEDRLKCFQAGPYSCRENAVALTKVQEAMMWLNKRTADRVARGVEGTSVV